MQSDHNPSNFISTSWIENLAIEEINMEESGVITFNEHLNPEYYLEESSINLMNEIRDFFEIYVNKFNEYRNGSGNGIKIFKISNTVNDFMLFRNSLKLIFARKGQDTISIGFFSNTGNSFGPRLNHADNVSPNLHELKAQVGAFNNISWHFQGEKVDVETLVRHYLTEFIKQSAR